MFENLVHSAENNNVRRPSLAHLFSLARHELKMTRIQFLESLLKFLLILNLLGGAACASKKTSKEIMEERNSSARPRSAAYAADAFYLDNRNPADRDVRAWDFFYKHCKLMGRENTAPNKADWDCTDPK